MKIPVVIVGRVRSKADLQAACDASTLWSKAQMIDQPELRKNLYDTGIYYKLEKRQDPLPGVERFQTADSLFELGYGDCDDLACVRAAQLQLQGIGARAIPIKSPGGGWHIVVKLPNGSIEDPSARLGMLRL